MGKEEGGDPAEAGQCVGVIEAERLTGQIARGHHQCVRGAGRTVREVREEQVMQRGVGEDDPELVDTGRDAVSNTRASDAGEKHDRSGRGAQDRLCGADLDEASGRGQVADHHGEGLIGPLLARA